MDFTKLSLGEMREFVKAHKIKKVSALNKADLAKFLQENYGDVAPETSSEEKASQEAPSESEEASSFEANAENASQRETSDNSQENETQGSAERAYMTDKKATLRTSRVRQRFDGRKQYKNNQTKRYEKAENSEQPQAPREERQPVYTADEVNEAKASYNAALQADQIENPEELDSGKMADGILEVMPEGFGFIRSDNYLPGEKDIYVSPAQIKRFRLKTGDIVTGAIRIKNQNEKFSALLFVESVNGMHPEESAKRVPFEELTPIFPNERIVMDGPDSPLPIRMIDLLSPIGKGQRGMIVSPPKAGKTTLLKQIAKCISSRYRDINLLVLLIDERPEEVTDIRESIEGPNVEVIYSTFDELPEHHKRVSEMVIERAKRLVEQGKDVVVLLDSITRLARAYNLTVQPSGRTLSGGLDPAALHMPKRFFGAARNMREGGSLTILATALVETGSKMDDVVFEEFKGTGNMELVLDRRLAEKRIFPAIDLAKSSTRRDDLLLSKEEQEVVHAVHKALSGNKAEEMLEEVLKLFMRTKTNKEFLYFVQKSLLRR